MTAAKKTHETLTIAAEGPELALGGLVQIETTLLQDAPWNARKTFDRAALDELMASIEEHGVQVPLTVRLLSTDGHYEVVAGHRRLKAACNAGLKTVPCIVRDLTEHQARELGLVDNLQRENVPAMEEAKAFGKLLETPGATVESIAAKLAKAPSYVGRRLQLLKAIAPVREALKAGAIEVGHALELARLDEAGQRQKLSRMGCGATLVEPDDVEDEGAESGVCRFCGCSDDDACEGGCSWANEEQTICSNPDCLAKFREETQQEEQPWRPTHYSVVMLRREIAESAHVDLKNAPFPLFDEIPPIACTECPKRAGNAQLLFDDCAQDTCTDRPCYNRKVNTWIESELARAKQEKRKLLKLADSWTSDKDKVYCSEYSGVRISKGPSECQDGEEGIWIEGRNIGHRATICRNQKCETHFGKRSAQSSGSTRPKQTEKEKADRRKILDNVKSEKAYRSALVAAIAEAKVDSKAADELNIEVCCAVIADTNSLYAAHLAKSIGWDEKLMGWNGSKQLRDKVAALNVGTRLLIARISENADELSVSEYNATDKCEDLEKIARLVGVDAKKVRAGISSTAAAPTEAAKPSKVKPAKKQVLSAAAKKRIADAQKKRWAAAKPVKKAAKKAGRK